MIVVDASIIVKWIKEDEPDSDKALSLFLQHRNNKEKITIPQLAFFEVANYLVTQPRLSRNDIKEALKILIDADLQVYQVKNDQMSETALLAKKYKTTFYDMLYAVVAQKHNTILITADEKFVAKTKFPFVKLLSEYSS